MRNGAENNARTISMERQGDYDNSHVYGDGYGDVYGDGDGDGYSNGDGGWNEIKPFKAVYTNGRCTTKTTTNTTKITNDHGETKATLDDLPTVSGGVIAAMCLPPVAVQIGWSIGEALVLPYLLQLGISASVANMIFLSNPAIGIVVQPMIGKWSDELQCKWGKRTPFLFVLHVIAMTGMIGLIFCEDIVAALGFTAIDREGHASLPMMILLFSSFGAMDLAHDALLLPSRALLNDTLPSSQIEQGNTMFSVATSIGSCVGLSLILLPTETLWPLSKLPEPIQRNFAVALLILFASNVSSFATAIYSNRQIMQLEKDIDRHIAQQQAALTNEIEIDSHSIDTHQSVHRLKAGSSSGGSVAPHDSNSPIESENVLDILHVMRKLPNQLLALLAIQLAWWYAVLCTTLWSTSFVSIELAGKYHDPKFSTSPNVLRYATAGLLANAITALLASLILPVINARFGVDKVYVISALCYASVLTALYLIPRQFWCFIICMVTLGIFMPPFLSNPFVIIEAHADGWIEGDHLPFQRHSNADGAKSETEEILESNRGVVTAAFNLSMVIAQLFSATVSGFVAQKAGVGALYLLAGVLLCATTVSAVIWYHSSKRKRWQLLRESVRTYNTMTDISHVAKKTPTGKIAIGRAAIVRQPSIIARRRPAALRQFAVFQRMLREKLNISYRTHKSPPPGLCIGSDSPMLVPSPCQSSSTLNIACVEPFRDSSILPIDI